MMSEKQYLKEVRTRLKEKLDTKFYDFEYEKQEDTEELKVYAISNISGKNLLSILQEINLDKIVWFSIHPNTENNKEMILEFGRYLESTKRTKISQFKIINKKDLYNNLEKFKEETLEEIFQKEKTPLYILGYIRGVLDTLKKIRQFIKIRISFNYIPNFKFEKMKKKASSQGKEAINIILFRKNEKSENKKSLSKKIKNIFK